MNRRQQRELFEYAEGIPQKMWKSYFFVWGLFLPCILIASLINPYMWKIVLDGNLDIGLWQLITWSFAFAFLTSLVATIPAHYIKFNYDDVNCGYPLWQFWKWGKKDQNCLNRRKKFGNVVVATGVIFVMIYVSVVYHQIYGNFKIKF